MAEQKKVYVVEDEPDIANQIVERLKAEGYITKSFENGVEAVERIQNNPPDVLLLDLMIPGIDGFEVARRVKDLTSIIVVTARDSEEDQLNSLGIGADYFFSKPFSMKVLMANVKAALRRVDRIKKQREKQEFVEDYEIGNLKIDHQNHQIYVNGEPRKLTPTEFDLVELLAHSPKEVFTRDKLLQTIWDWQSDASDTRTVDAHIRSVRKKLGEDYIRTIHGLGYAFEPQEAK